MHVSVIQIKDGYQTLASFTDIDLNVGVVVAERDPKHLPWNLTDWTSLLFLQFD